VSWSLSTFVQHRAFYQTSSLLILAVITFLRPYEDMIWTLLGLIIGRCIYKFFQANILQQIKCNFFKIYSKYTQRKRLKN